MESNTPLHRRRLLTVVGGAVLTTAGCLGNDDESTDDSNSNSSDDARDGDDTGDGETDVKSHDGSDDDSTEREDGDAADDSNLDVVEHDYSTLSHEDQEVPLVPVEDAHEWYAEGEAYLVDTRGQRDFAETHIAGALWSPAPDGPENDPADDVARDAILVTYCDCPHSIAVRRAASLLEEGYVNVFVLEGGLEAWMENDYPVSGGAVD